MDLFNGEGFDLWRLLAGLGIFLFGMFLLEEGIHALSGQAFQRLLQRFTNRPIKAVLTGTLATAVLQSSSAVSLMVLAFVGAGTMAMGNAVGVVVGANLGTTVTAWIVATIGFKMNIEGLALPFIGLGGLVLIFLGKRPRYVAFSRLLTGFGFLFMGLDFMKEAVSTYTETVSPDFFQGIQPWMYFITGVLLTAVTQSSSASLAIILTSVHTGMTTFHDASLFVIGANIGTTVTVMLGALRGPVIKKQVAASHLLFNWITGLLVFLMLPFLTMFVDYLMLSRNDPVFSLAVFHTLFNMVGVILFLPFTAQLGRLVRYFYPDRSEALSFFVSRMPARVGQAAAEALRKEAWYLIFRIMRYHNQALGFHHPISSPVPELQNLPEKEEKEHYINLQTICKEMHAFASQLQEESLNPVQGEIVNRSLFAARMALFSAKWMKDLHADLVEMNDHSFTHIIKEELQQHQVAMYVKLESYFNHPTDHLVAYDNLKEALKRLDKESPSAFAQHDAIRLKSDPLAMARILTIHKTWYLAWRNLLLAIRELDLEMATNEEEL